MTLYPGLTFPALLRQIIKENFQHNHQKQALSGLKRDLLLINNGDIIAQAWDRGDLDRILCAADFLEAYRSKVPDGEIGKDTAGITAIQTSILDNLITNIDEQMALHFKCQSCWDKRSKMSRFLIIFHRK